MEPATDKALVHQTNEHSKQHICEHERNDRFLKWCRGSMQVAVVHAPNEYSHNCLPRRISIESVHIWRIGTKGWQGPPSGFFCFEIQDIKIKLLMPKKDFVSARVVAGTPHPRRCTMSQLGPAGGQDGLCVWMTHWVWLAIGCWEGRSVGGCQVSQTRRGRGGGVENPPKETEARLGFGVWGLG